jgi:leucyl/phenylalanyl-tRNA--protein transferase
MRQGRFNVTFDQDFAAVMRACAEPRAGKTPLTWLTPRVMKAFWDLHKAGHAHSVELWNLEQHLVGGIFGIAIGEIFFGESQFSRVRDASKIASAYLNCHLAHWGFLLRDAKWMSNYHAGAGFKNIDRSTFEAILAEHASRPSRVGKWNVDVSLDVANWQPLATCDRVVACGN